MTQPDHYDLLAEAYMESSSTSRPGWNDKNLAALLRGNAPLPCGHARSEWNANLVVPAKETRETGDLSHVGYLGRCRACEREKEIAMTAYPIAGLKEATAREAARGPKLTIQQVDEAIQLVKEDWEGHLPVDRLTDRLNAALDTKLPLSLAMREAVVSVKLDKDETQVCEPLISTNVAMHPGPYTAAEVLATPAPSGRERADRLREALEGTIPIMQRYLQTANEEEIPETRRALAQVRTALAERDKP